MSIDLSYDSPSPPSGLADLARQRGRRLRRSRRASAAGALIAVSALGVATLPGGGSDAGPERLAAANAPGSPVRLEDLPGWRPGPAPAPPTQDTVLPSDLPVDEARGLGARGQVHLMHDEERGYRVYVLVRAVDEALCLATTEPTKPIPVISFCNDDRKLPADGFAQGQTFSGNGSPANIIAFGLFAGPVSRIVVDHPKASVEATVVDVAGLGTLYWAVTPATFSYSFGEQPRSDYDSDDVRRTAYRDGTPVYSCIDSVCNASR